MSTTTTQELPGTTGHNNGNGKTRRRRTTKKAAARRAAAPALAEGTAPIQLPQTRARPGRPSSNGATPAHPLIIAMVHELPPRGQKWTADGACAFLQAMSANLRLAYDLPDAVTITLKAA